MRLARVMIRIKKYLIILKNDMFQLHDMQNLDINSQFFDSSKLDRFIQNKFKERKKALEVLGNISNPKENLQELSFFKMLGLSFKHVIYHIQIVIQ